MSGCNPYLESLSNYINGAPPWTPTNRGHGIMSRSLKYDPEVSPRNPKELRTDTYQNIFIQPSNNNHAFEPRTNICNQFSFVFHVVPCHLIHQFHEFRVLSHTNTIVISITSLSFISHAKVTSIYQFNLYHIYSMSFLILHT